MTEASRHLLTREEIIMNKRYQREKVSVCNTCSECSGECETQWGNDVYFAYLESGKCPHYKEMTDDEIITREYDITLVKTASEDKLVADAAKRYLANLQLILRKDKSLVEAGKRFLANLRQIVQRRDSRDEKLEQILLRNL